MTSGDDRSNRVLVVDDDEDFALSLADILGLAGHEVEVAHDGESAIRRCEQQDFDWLLMDVRLPGKNGVDAFLEIRSSRPGIKCIVMTGYAVPDLLERARGGGAHAVLNKPLDFERLERLLEQDLPPGLVLVVDDDSMFAESICDSLADAGHATLIARDGEEALDLARRHSPAVVILDLRLPKMGGVEVFKALPSVPTVVVTAFADEESEALTELRELSVAGIFSKPFDPSRLVSMVERLAKGG